jgi:hypothetical protein
MVFDDLKWRVPPRFLKSHEAMSEYAHKVLAPKLNPQQRELLLKYFSVLFQDGFESGDFGAWTGTSITSGDSLTVASDNPHHGTYSAKMVRGVTTDDYTYAYKTLASTYTTLYQRVYAKINDVSTTPFDADGKRVDFVIFFNTSWGRIVQAGLYRDAGVVKWHLQYRNAAAWYRAFSATPTPQANTWYCFEVMQTTGSSGSDRLYINGNLAIEVTGVSNNDRGSPNQIQAFGEYYVASSVTVWIDCVVAADAGPIGPEVVPVAKAIVKADTGPSPRSKLGFNPTTLKLG